MFFCVGESIPSLTPVIQMELTGTVHILSQTRIPTNFYECLYSASVLVISYNTISSSSFYAGINYSDQKSSLASYVHFSIIVIRYERVLAAVTKRRHYFILYRLSRIINHCRSHTERLFLSKLTLKCSDVIMEE